LRISVRFIYIGSLRVAMEGENRIVELWLKNKGYSLVSNINAGKNKVINLIAIKKEDDKTIIRHVEVFVSLAEQIDMEKISNKFSDPVIKAEIRKTLKKMGYDGDAIPLLVANSYIAPHEGRIETLLFENVLRDVLSTLDQKNYPENITRVLQLVKFIALNDKNMTYDIINDSLSRANKEIVIQKLLTENEASLVFSRKSNIELTKKCFKASPLFSPYHLAKELPDMFTQRSLNLFIKTLFENDKLKDFTKQTQPQQKALTLFFE